MFGSTISPSATGARDESLPDRKRLNRASVGAFVFWSNQDEVRHDKPAMDGRTDLHDICRCGECPAAEPAKAPAAGIFKLSSPMYADNAPLARKNAGDRPGNANCVGQSISPPLKWANPPDGTTSFALLLVDPEGRGGLGVVHMVTYGIPASVTGFAEGELSKPSDKFVGGKSTMGLATYFSWSLHPARRLASLYVYADRDRSRSEGVTARHDARRVVRRAGRTRQRRCGVGGPVPASIVGRAAQVVTDTPAVVVRVAVPLAASAARQALRPCARSMGCFISLTAKSTLTRPRQTRHGPPPTCSWQGNEVSIQGGPATGWCATCDDGEDRAK